MYNVSIEFFNAKTFWSDCEDVVTYVTPRVEIR